MPRFIVSFASLVNHNSRFYLPRLQFRAVVLGLGTYLPRYLQFKYYTQINQRERSAFFLIEYPRYPRESSIQLIYPEVKAAWLEIKVARQSKEQACHF